MYWSQVQPSSTVTVLSKDDQRYPERIMVGTEIDSEKYKEESKLNGKCIAEDGFALTINEDHHHSTPPALWRNICFDIVMKKKSRD